MKPPKDVVAATLKQIELDSRHPTRKLAARLIEACRERAQEWQSDAEKEGLAVVNATTGSGAPVLQVDEILRKSQPNHGKR